MKAKVLQFPKQREKIMKKKIDEQVLALMMKHSKLIESRRKRGFSVEAIVKAIKEAERRR